MASSSLTPIIHPHGSATASSRREPSLVVAATRSKRGLDVARSWIGRGKQGVSMGRSVSHRQRRVLRHGSPASRGGSDVATPSAPPPLAILLFRFNIMIIIISSSQHVDIYDLHPTRTSPCPFTMVGFVARLLIRHDT